MPTLVQVPASQSSQQDMSDASETLLHDDSVVLYGANEEEESNTISQARRKGDESAAHGNESRPTVTLPGVGGSSIDDQDATFDDSATILSRTLLSHDSTRNSEGEESLLNDSCAHDKKNAPGRREDKCKPSQMDVEITRPNQHLYRSTYEKNVKKTIRDFETRHPGKLRDYRTMSVEEKAREQQHVLGLLACLGISKGSRPEPSERVLLQRETRHEKQSPISSDRRRLLDDTMSPLLSPGYHGRSSPDNNSFCMGDSSPIARSSSSLYRDESIQALKSEFMLDPQSPIQHENLSVAESPESPHFPVNMSSESVELVRAADRSMSSQSHSFESPERLRSNPYKRQASSSAKRGADLVRHKYNEDVEPPCDNHGAESDLEIAISSRMGRMSISPASSGPKDLFVASQSPISPRFTHCSSESEESSNDDRGRISLLEHQETRVRRPADDTIDTFDNRSYQQNKEKRRAMREIPVNVALKDGATFHLNKLDVKRNDKLSRKMSKNGKPQARRRLVNFPDPLVRYNKRQREVLNDMFEWIHQAERENVRQTDGPPAARILFSLSCEQIIDLSLKLFLNNNEVADRTNTSASLQGRTIIVVRTKEDTAKWESSLRESTGCSVFNHATLPLSERIRASLAEKATMFDIILTTFDALKSPDTAIPVDDSGRALLTTVGTEKGWFSSRTASQHDCGPQTCKKLSVLHRVNFKRIVYVDFLGRKSFLAKEGTARASAAVALLGDSRLVFFCKSELDGISATVALRKSDRRAIKSLSSVLHLDNDDDEEDQEEDLLENYAVDLKDLC